MRHVEARERILNRAAQRLSEAQWLDADLSYQTVQASGLDVDGFGDGAGQLAVLEGARVQLERLSEAARLVAQGVSDRRASEDQVAELIELGLMIENLQEEADEIRFELGVTRGLMLAAQDERLLAARQSVRALIRRARDEARAKGGG